VPSWCATCTRRRAGHSGGAVIALLISVISAYIGAQQLRPFGAEIYTVDLVAIGVLRELGVLLTAIMSRAAPAARTLRTRRHEAERRGGRARGHGHEPVRVLVLPRVVALVLVMPCSRSWPTSWAWPAGRCSPATDRPAWSQFVMRLDSSISDTTFWPAW